MRTQEKPAEWLEARLELAQALSSGRYVQQPHSQEQPPLRDAHGRYTIDGVAADLSPIIWTMLEGSWRAVWIDELSGTAALEKAADGAITGLTPREEEQLLRSNAGETKALPEITACQLGLHDDSAHPSQLMIHPEAVPAELASRLRLPNRRSPYPADGLTFIQAATLIAQHPLCLGPGPEHEDDGGT